jgi:YggT family protein
VNFLCTLDPIILKIFQAYAVVLIIYAVLSWIPSLRGEWTRYLSMLVDPLLNPIRRIIPPVGGLDIAFLVLFILVIYVVPSIIHAAIGSACYSIY